MAQHTPDTSKSEGSHSRKLEFVNSPDRGWALPSMVALYQYRQMILAMAWRDVIGLYRQSGLGMLWMLIRPFAQMVAFTFLFGHVAQLDSEGLPYSVFNFTALVPWSFFAVGLGQATTSVVSSSSMYSKLRFPRLVLPITGILSGVGDFLVQCVILALLLVYYGIYPTYDIVWLPCFFLLLLVTMLGTSLILCTLNVMFRDVHQALPLILQIWMFASPVVYSASVVSPQWQTFYYLNPMTAVINGVRWCLLGTPCPSNQEFWISIGVACASLLIGMLLYQRHESTFPDYLMNP